MFTRLLTIRRLAVGAPSLLSALFLALPQLPSATPALAAEVVLELKDIERGLASSRTTYQRSTYARDVVDGAMGRIESEIVDVAANGDVSSITPAGIRLECRVGLNNGEKPIVNAERSRQIKDVLSKLNVGDGVVVSGKMTSSFSAEAPAEGNAPAPAQARLGPAVITLEACEVARRN